MPSPTTLSSSIVRAPSALCDDFTHILLRLDSGHGGQTKDHDGDEGDGYDEGTS